MLTSSSCQASRHMVACCEDEKQPFAQATATALTYSQPQPIPNCPSPGLSACRTGPVSHAAQQNAAAAQVRAVLRLPLHAHPEDGR